MDDSVSEGGHKSRPCRAWPCQAGRNRIMDKLSRLAALRPVSTTPRRQETGRGRSAERLLELLGGECRANALGNHVIVRYRFPEPRVCKIGPETRRRLLPGAAEAAADPARWLFLDTETTGLAGGTGTYAFLVGTAWWDNDGLTIEQFFMRDHGEEPSVLHEVVRSLSERPVLVTFNGKSFDWPLLETRFRMARMHPVPSPDFHVDLLHPARRVWRYRLRSVALAELERHVLELDRGFDIPSESIPARYFEFLRGGPPEPVAEIFQHNAMDLRGLAALAVHLAGLMENPECAAQDPTELYGLSRLLQLRGEATLASRICELALEGGLGDTEARAARHSLALMAKREGKYGRANELWRQLAEESPEGIEAREHLAIYYEHYARDIGHAARLTRESLAMLREALHAGMLTSERHRRWHARLQHRLERLNRKLGA